MKYMIAILIITGLMILWIFIQFLWKNIFLGSEAQEDALASRSDCGNCGRSTTCSKKQSIKN